MKRRRRVERQRWAMDQTRAVHAEGRWSETNIEGPKRFEGVLRRRSGRRGTIATSRVQAFPTPGDFRIDNIQGKAAYERRARRSGQWRRAPPRW